MGIRGAIAQDQVLALFGTTADAFKSTDLYTYSTILTDTAFAFFPALIVMVCIPSIWRKSCSWVL